MPLPEAAKFGCGSFVVTRAAGAYDAHQQHIKPQIPAQIGEAQVSLSLKSIARGLVAISLALVVIPMVSAQTSLATLDAPPSGVAPAAGDVLRPGHLGRQVAEVESIVHFYHDLIGLELLGARDQPRPYFGNRGLQEVAALAEGVPNPYEQVSRAALLPIPGTAAAPGGPEMTIEAIEIKGIESHPFNPALTDPGASYLKLIVSDLDKTLALLKAERYAVSTVGGNPVQLSGWPGIAGKIRAVLVRDPDGYPVELMEVTPAPATTAAPGSKVLGARVTVVVDDLEKTCRLYQQLAGPELKFWLNPALLGDKPYEDLTGIRGQFRLAEAMVPGSPVVMELIEYQNHNRHFQHGHFQDPGAAHFLFMTKDDDVIIGRLKAANLHTASSSNAPVFIAPTTRMFFVPDSQGFWLEFMDHDVKKDPTAK
jgi:catechol 2,3-dioxygenase-like lactoylglutathione lyase family enzyme